MLEDHECEAYWRVIKKKGLKVGQNRVICCDIEGAMLYSS